MGGGRALQIGAAHKGGRPGRGDSPDVEMLRGNLGHSGTIVSLWHFCISCRPACWYTVRMTLDIIATILTGIVVLLGVWHLIDGVRRDLTNQITSVNTRIDNVLLADRRRA